MEPNERIVTAHICRNPALLPVLENHLREEGVRFDLLEENDFLSLQAHGRFLVPEKEAKRAKELIAAFYENHREDYPGGREEEFDGDEWAERSGPSLTSDESENSGPGERQSASFAGVRPSPLSGTKNSPAAAILREYYKGITASLALTTFFTLYATGYVTDTDPVRTVAFWFLGSFLGWAGVVGAAIKLLSENKKV